MVAGAPPARRAVPCRHRNGRSNTAAKRCANRIVSGNARASEAMNAGTPSGSRPATISSYTSTTIGPWVR